jgi:hypothetical protein
MSKLYPPHWPDYEAWKAANQPTIPVKLVRRSPADQVAYLHARIAELVAELVAENAQLRAALESKP